MTAEVKRAWLLAEPNAPALAVRRLGPRDVEITVPPYSTDPWDGVIGLETVGTIAADSTRYLPARGAPVSLHVFDGWRVGEGITYGDGKRGNDVALGWRTTDSRLEWRVRLEERARYRVAVEYATPGADTGSFEIAAGDQRLAGRAIPTGGAFVTRDIGEVALGPGELTISVRAAVIPAADLMRLRLLRLTPVAEPGVTGLGVP